MLHNRATIYSNGIADFQRVFPVEGDRSRKISIPVRQQHLGDVLGSLTISGEVHIESPPSYQPANQDDGNIRISSSNVLTDLVSQLAGAEVEISFGNETVSGRLVGVHDRQVASGGEPVVEESLVVMGDGGMSRVSLNQVQSLRFVDAAIQSEIDKALSRRLREIKPNSTFVDLELSTELESTDAIIQYTIPAAAWKISYRILINDQGPLEFHGHAIVDNNTDEDWKDFVIAVVMGQPITFTTDLADSKTPRRSHVNIVQESALGAVEIEEAPMAMMEMERGAGAVMAAGGSPARGGARRMAKKMSAPSPRKPSAGIAESEIRETGDFCIFESAGPVSIDAHRSAVIPVFVTTLDETKPVLHFKTENHSERPFRALQFKNTTDHSLGRGICTVYDGTTYAGSCVLPATKPSGDALLPHALETAVRVRPKKSPTKKRRIGIRISEGVAYESYHQRANTVYHIQSSRDEQFSFIVDYDRRLIESKVEVQVSKADGDSTEFTIEELKNGWRVGFDLKSNDRLVVSLSETSTSKSKMALTGPSNDRAGFKIGWLYDSLIDSNEALVNDPAVKNCVELQKLLDAVEEEHAQAQQEIIRLTNRQERLRKNIGTGAADQQTARWQSDLGKSEDSIVQLEEEKLPELLGKQKLLRDQLYDALHNLVLVWNAE